MVSIQVFSTIVAVALLANSCSGIGLLHGLGLYGGNYYGAGLGRIGCGGLGRIGCGGLACGGLGGLGYSGLGGLGYGGCGCRCLTPGIVNSKLSVSKVPSACGLRLGLPPSSCCLNICKPSLCNKLKFLKNKLLAKKIGLLGCGCGCF